jgi:acid phosphatase (class A)
MALIRVFACLMILMIAAPAMAQHINDIKYLDSMWDEEFNGISQAEPKFLSKDMVIDIPPPPENDDPVTIAEIETLFDYAANARTPEQLDKIIREQKGTTDLVFGLGSPVPEDIKSQVEDIRGIAMADLDYFTYREKRRFKRARPTQIAPTLTVAIPVPGSAAYPSGHATIAQFGALVYSYIDPENKTSYMKFANDVGLRRAISGIHYPSDADAGQALAGQVFDALLKNVEFKAAIDDAKNVYQAYKAELKDE